MAILYIGVGLNGFFLFFTQSISLERMAELGVLLGNTVFIAIGIHVYVVGGYMKKLETRLNEIENRPRPAATLQRR